MQQGESMKKRLTRALIAAVAIIALCISYHSESNAKIAYIEPVQGNPFEEMVKIRCTCYCEHGKTAINCNTDYGIAAGKKEWLGYVIELNAINPDGSIGQLIGFFEVKDTGAGMDTDGDGYGDSIKNGQSIDIWLDTLEEAYMWRDTYGDYVYMKIIKGEG